MAVLLPDGMWRTWRRTHPAGRDGHGTPIPGAQQASAWMPGAGRRRDDLWSVRLDPAAEGVRVGDGLERQADGLRLVARKVTVTAIPGVSDVDFVAVEAVAAAPEVDSGWPV